MQLKVVTAENIECFDQFIMDAPNGHIFQSSLWGEIKKPEWEPLRLVLEIDGCIIAAATILKHKIPLSNKTFFYLPRGPVLNNWHDPVIFNGLISKLLRLAEVHRAVFIKIDPALPEEEQYAGILETAGFVTARGKYLFGGLQPRYTFILDISKDLGDIMSDFPKKIRYKINYGPQRGLTFKNPGETGIDHFVKVMKETGRRANFVGRDAAYYHKLYRILAEQGLVNLTLGYYQGEVVIAGITVVFGDRAWAICGGQTNRFRNHYAYHAMIWERIKWAKGKGARWFDFYGVPGQISTDHPLYGLFHFKKSFGGEYRAFVGEKDLVISPLYYCLWTRLFPLLRMMLLKLLKLKHSIYQGS